jgi:hypothetical protein
MTDTTTQVEEQTQPQAQAGEQQQGADLSIQDLSAMKSIIDVVSSRGAFKPAEMAMVGQVYNKLSSFLDAVAKQAEAQKDAQQTQGA